MGGSDSEAVLARLQALANPTNVAGMARYGITGEHVLGISVKTLRVIAKELGTDHQLALDLWASGIHEARILASLVDDPAQVSQQQMDEWISQVDSWDLCDQLCANLFQKTPFAFDKAIEWSASEQEFVKRAAFSIVAAAAGRSRKTPEPTLAAFLPIIAREATDDRNYVRKAVNWALRDIGKRSRTLNRQALDTAHQIQQLDSRSARWIASDAIRELTSEAVQSRLKD